MALECRPEERPNDLGASILKKVRAQARGPLVGWNGKFFASSREMSAVSQPATGWCEVFATRSGR